KFVQLNLLSQICLPVGEIVYVKSIEQALRAAKHIGYPLVLKPLSGSTGKLVFVDLRSEKELRSVLNKIQINSDEFLLQSFFPGEDHRMLIINGKVVAAALKIPAAVIGDGHHSIVELAQTENRNPLRVNGPMKEIVLDAEAERVLAQQGFALDSVPAAGSRVHTRGTSNISTGGSAIDVTSRVHPDNASAAVRAAKALGLTIAGVDFICPDISRSWYETSGGICEVNSYVGTRPHDLGNPDQDITGAILETIYPVGDDGRIPTAIVTGTMGKTTTCSMLSSILTCSGHKVGLVTTEGVSIGDEIVQPGDMAGPKGHAIALCDPTVTAAVLETSRGALLRKGTYLDHCDVAALTNVGREHIGMNGIETLDDLAKLKRKVLDAARKAVVLNAEDPRCLALAAEFSPNIRTILYSRNGETEALREHLRRGGEVVFLSKEDGPEAIVAAKGSEVTRLAKSAELPSTAGGIFWPQTTNAMAATALAMGLGIAFDAIAEGLMRYGKEFPAVKGRFSLAEGFPMPFLFDYATFPPGFAVMSPICDAITVSGKRICAVTLPGNRPNWQYADCAAELVGHFDLFVCFERDDLRRGVPLGELAANLAKALVEAGVEPASVLVVQTIADVAKIIAREATPEDFVVVFAAGPKQDEPFRAAFRERDLTQATA
ncbi:MAG: Mur ligase family protein, partial [Micropepsaceae bacterium]